MNTIWKYSLQSAPNFSIEMPRGAQILTVQLQGGRPYLWALVNPDAVLEPRYFFLAPTGESFVPPALDYIGTFQMDGGAFVAHLFEHLLAPIG